MSNRLILLLAAAPLIAAAAQRDTVPFSFAWRFFLGNPGAPPAACNASSFPLPNATGVQCTGLQASPAATADACRQSACDNGAGVWQFCTDAAACAAGNRSLCWIGECTGPARRNAQWVGGARDTPSPGPPLPPAQPGFDDSQWLVVDAPHDALITTPYSNASSNSQGSIPKSVAWYRKHFVLPSQWQGSHVEVYLEGSFSITTAFLNGVQVMNHTGSGYTSL